jgi:hypothetical protein
MNHLLKNIEHMSEKDLAKMQAEIKARLQERTKLKKEVLGELFDKLKKIPEDSPVHATIDVLSQAISRLGQGRRVTRRGRKLRPEVKEKLEAAIEAGQMSPDQLSKQFDTSLSYIWLLKRKLVEKRKREDRAKIEAHKEKTRQETAGSAQG